MDILHREAVITAYEAMIRYHTELRNWGLVEVYFRMLGDVLEKYNEG